MRRLLLILACLLVLLLIAAPFLIAWEAVYTEGGAQFLARHVPRQIGDIGLEITGVTGTVAGGLHVERVEIDHPLVHLTFTGIDGRATPAPLLLQTIRVPQGHVASALIEVKRRTRPATPSAPVFLPHWLLISAEQASVDHAVLTVYNGAHLEATGISGAAVIRSHVIRFFQADGMLEDVRISGHGDLKAADPIGLDVEGTMHWQPQGQPAWDVAGSARGDLNALQIVAHSTSPLSADAGGQMLDLTGHFHWRGNAVVRAFNLSAWGIADTVLGTVTGRVAASGEGNHFSGHGPLTPAGLHAGEFEAQFEGYYAERVVTATHMEARHAPTGAHAIASGTFAIVDHGPRLDLSGSWTDFRWPLAGREALVKSVAGTFTLQGILPYKVHLRGRGQAGTLPEMPLEVEATLGKDRFEFHPAEIDLFGGHASVSGVLAWSPAQRWSVSGNATGIDPAALRPDLPGSLNFGFSASGGFDAKSSLDASFTGVSGKLRGLSASGSGSLSHAGNTWTFAAVRVGLGTSSLALDGRLSDSADLRFALATHDLSLLGPGNRGVLRASGTWRGTLTNPVIVATAHGSGIDYQGIKIDGLDADIDFDPQALQRDSKIDVRARHLSWQGRTADTMSFTLDGPPSAYRLQLAGSGTGLAGSASALGAYNNGSFIGQVTTVSVKGSEALQLSLEHPVSLVASAAEVRLEWMCLVGTPGSMCADANWTAARWSSTVMANQLPLRTLTAGMTAAVDYQGTIGVLARAQGGAQLPLTGTLRAELANAELVHKLASHKVEHTVLGSGTVTVTATPAVLHAEAALKDSQVGTLGGKFEAQRTTARWQDMPFEGELHASTSQLGLISLYFPDVDRVTGHVDANLTATGTLGQPRFKGRVQLTDGEIVNYQVNIGLRAVNFDAQLTDAGLDFNGSAKAGAGQVKANGHLEWRDLLPYGRFHLEGTNLRVADVREAQIDASPNLDFNVSGRRIEVTGDVTVPFARIAPRDITNAVRTSPDEVIVGNEPEDPSKRFEVLSTITLTLGDKVNVDASGLQARIIGGLTVKSGYDAITRGTGELSVAEGKYMAYGRLLDIKRGRLMFNGPVDDPGIDVRAQKEFPDVTAGVDVKGTLQNPRLSFFSDPPLPQSQIQSLLVSGGAIDVAQSRAPGSTAGAGVSGSNYAIGQAAAMLGQQYGGLVGIQNVGLETDLTNETSLVLGSYLSPRLYVSYGVSLTQQLNIIKLRYTLGDHWAVKVEAGQAQGADLVYSIEH
jgi:translocation and assembly module TamB